MNHKELSLLATNKGEQILSLLGIEFSIAGRWLTSQCNIHGGDNHHGFGFNSEKGTWRCFTHRCEQIYGNDIAGLVAGIKKCSYNEAIDWLVEHFEELDLVEKKIKVMEEKIYPEMDLKKLLRTDFYLKRGFSQETVNSFYHGLAESGSLRCRVVFPIRNAKGFIIAYSGRWAGQEKIIDGKVVCFNDAREVPKWKHTSFKKSDNLYNFNVAKDLIEKEIIIVESIGNVMRWWEAGFKNVVACMGSSLSSKHTSMLIGKTQRVILAFDNDDAGIKASQNSIKRLEHYVNSIELSPPRGKDWADITNQEVKDIYEKIKN